MERKVAFIVPSVIYYKERRLSYSKIRSQFSPEQRAEQTLKTIQSIRERVPGAKVLLFEMGLRRDLPLELEKQTDKYIYLGDRLLVRLSVDSIFKGIGEAVSLMHMKKYLLNEDADFYFKISGRYFLNDNFRLQDWEGGGFVFRRYGQDISTRLYGFKKEMVKIWFDSLWKGIPWLFLNRPIEHTMPKFISAKFIKDINILGLSGLGSAFGDSFNE